MQVKTKAIVLSVLKFQEKSLIVKCFTQSDGLKSYFVRNAFSSQKNNQKIAYFQPLNILEIFLSEVLHHSIKEEEKNENLFSFLETAFQWLDTHDEISNFHLILLLEMTKYLGFYPDISDRELPYFETIDGVFSLFQGTSCLSKHETSLLNRLIDLKFDDMQNNFASVERQLLLKILLDFYAVHLDGFKKPKSLDVLKEVFS